MSAETAKIRPGGAASRSWQTVIKNGGKSAAMLWPGRKRFIRRLAAVRRQVSNEDRGSRRSSG